MRYLVFPIVALVAAGCRVKRSNLTPLHADTQQPDSASNSRRRVAAIKVSSRVPESSLPADSVARLVLDSVRELWYNAQYELHQESRFENGALVRQVLSGHGRDRFVTNEECVDTRGEASFRVIKAQTIVEVPGVEPREIRWIKVDLALTKAGERNPSNAARFWHREWEIAEAAVFDCLTVANHASPALADDGQAGSVAIRDWIRRSLDEGGQVLGVSISQIAGIWDADSEEWRIRYSPAIIAS